MARNVRNDDNGIPDQQGWGMKSMLEMQASLLFYLH